jgi:hypothetical protein
MSIRDGPKPSEEEIVGNMRKKRPYHDGELVSDFSNRDFERDLREAQLPNFPGQQNLKTPLDEVLWILWVVRDYFEHRSPIYASDIAHLLEIRGIASAEVNVERALARADRRVIRKNIDQEVKRSAYMVSEKGVDYLRNKYALAGIKALVIDGTKPWTDRHSTLPELAKELIGRICVVDKFYGGGSLAVLHYFRHGSPLQFLTGKTNENGAAFSRELKDLKKEVHTLEVRRFPTHNELHDRYIIADNALIIVGHGIKDIGNKESFLLLLKGDATADLRKTLREKFDDRWKTSIPLN